MRSGQDPGARTPRHSPEEFKRRLREPGISLEELDKMLERSLKP